MMKQARNEYAVLRVVSINNGILATGDSQSCLLSLVLNLQLLTCIDSGGWHWTGPTSTGCSSCSYFYNDVLKFDPITLQWTNVGAMSEGRYGHGASVVKAVDVQEYCN